MQKQVQFHIQIKFAIQNALCNLLLSFKVYLKMQHDFEKTEGLYNDDLDNMWLNY